MSAGAPRRLRWLRLAVSLAVGAVIFSMALPKLQAPGEFLKAVRSYGILPEEPPWILNFTAVWLPVLELGCALALITGLARRPAALILAGMLSAFTTAVFLRTLEIYQAGGTSFCDIAFDCGCGAGVVNACVKFGENLALILGCLLILFTGEQRREAAA